MKRQVADRLFMTAVSMTVVAVSQFEPDSLSYMMVKQGGLPAKACMGFLFIASFVALIDTIINDMLPERFTFRSGLGRRRGLWSCIGITYAGIVFVSVKADLSWAVAIFYFWFSVRCMAVAWLDLYYEYEPVVRDVASPISTSITGALSDE